MAKRKKWSPETVKRRLWIFLIALLIVGVLSYAAYQNMHAPKPEQSDPVDLSDIPAFSGNPFVQINGDKPVFSADELKTVGYEKYSDLDALGRCGAALASCGIEIMPGQEEERESISGVTPSGWVQAQYDIVPGKYLYNRCHLIGWQLSAENANKRNIITGTKYLNINGMLPFENMIADYIKETKNHVAYRVTPIYEGYNLVCSGVQLEAYSIEDSGEGICFNVYCYNVQPGVAINYATGSSCLGDVPPGGTAPADVSVSETKLPVTSDRTEMTAPSTEVGEYVLNINSKKIHYPTCRYAVSMSEESKKTYVGSLQELISDGYTTCGVCFK